MGPGHRRYLLAIGLFTLTACTQASDHAGQVIAITDGDTIKILPAAEQPIKVRLADIDAPERGQPYGKKAKQALSDKIYRQRVQVEEVAIDRYGRLVGRVFLEDRHINAELVEDGAAWVYRRYSDDPHLLRLEAQARAEGRGLWGLPDAQRIPPWQWRKRQRTDQGSRAKGAAPSAPK